MLVLKMFATSNLVIPERISIVECMTIAILGSYQSTVGSYTIIHTLDLSLMKYKTYTTAGNITSKLYMLDYTHHWSLVTYH